jgi:hypothetical protein
MRDVRRATPSGIGNRRDPRDLDACPAQQHGQCACVVSVATQVCVEVNTHIARMPGDAVPRLVARIQEGRTCPALRACRCTALPVRS